VAETLLGIIATIHTAAIPWAAMVMRELRRIKNEIHATRAEANERIEALTERVVALESTTNAQDAHILPEAGRNGDGHS